jgi:hypothetical protein
MKTLFLIAAVLPGFALAGCSNQYLQRKDTVTFGAGDAVAWDSAQQIANPWPRRAQNTRIATNGEKGVQAVRQYIKGQPHANGGGGLVTVNVGGAGGAGSR